MCWPCELLVIADTFISLAYFQNNSHLYIIYLFNLRVKPHNLVHDIWCLSESDITIKIKQTYFRRTGHTAMSMRITCMSNKCCLKKFDHVAKSVIRGNFPSKCHYSGVNEDRFHINFNWFVKYMAYFLRLLSYNTQQVVSDRMPVICMGYITL